MVGTWACFASILRFRELGAVETVVQETKMSGVMGMLYSKLVWMHEEQELYNTIYCLLLCTAWFTEEEIFNCDHSKRYHSAQAHRGHSK